MNRTSSVIQKVTDLLIWDDVTKSQQIFTVDIKKSVVYSQTTGQKITGLKTTYIIENRCGKDGVGEVARIITELDWEEVVAFIFITNNMAEVKNVDKNISPTFQGQGDLYGIDPDYYFSLVPIRGTNHKKIENFILSLKSSGTKKEKVKIFIKKVLVFLGCSNALYEQYVYCFHRD